LYVWIVFEILNNGVRGGEAGEKGGEKGETGSTSKPGFDGGERLKEAVRRFIYWF